MGRRLNTAIGRTEFKPRGSGARIGLVWLLLAASSAVLSACSDNGNVLGSDTGGGSSNSGGTTSGGATGHAGDTPAGGGSTSNGGSADGGGTTDSKGGSGGDTGDCQTAQCVRANICLDHCGGNVISSGCCTCPADTVEVLSCGAGDGGSGDGGSGDGGSGSACVGTTCATGQTCVAHRTIGGAVHPPIAGKCTAGMHIENNNCENDYGYTCAELVGCTTPSNSCECAPASGCAYAHSCSLPASSPSEWLDTQARLVCQQQVP